MNPVLFVFLYAFNLLESTESTLNVYCGSRYRLGNETVAIYQHFGKKLRLTVSERWNGHGRVPIWNVTSVTQKYAAKIEKFLSRNGTTQTLTIQMNNITNGAVVWYAYDGERFKSGEATVLIGELPTVVVHNNEGMGNHLPACGENRNNEARSFCSKITSLPSSTVSLYCGSTGVRVRETQNALDDVLCWNVTCDDANLTVVATNCFGNDTKTVLGGCSPHPILSNVTATSTSNSPDVIVIILSNSSNNYSGPFHNATSKHSGGYVPWQISLAALFAAIVFLTVVISLVVCACYRQRKQREHNVNRNRHVQFQNDDSNSHEDVSPYIVTPGSKILESISRDKRRSVTVDSQTRIYCSIDLESSDDGYLVPVGLTDRGSEELEPNINQSRSQILQSRDPDVG